MLNVFKKIWNFSKEEQVYIKKSILAGFLHAVFNALEFGAIYYMLVNIFSKTLDYKAIFVCLGILVISLVGKIMTKNHHKWHKHTLDILWQLIRG